jgi:hypothetical protein
MRMRLYARTTMEDRERDDQEADDVVDEQAVVDRRGAGLLRFRQRGVLPGRQRDEQVR